MRALPPSPTPQLTVKQRRFLKSYVETGNGTRAALDAYGTADPQTAHAIAAENLRKPAIQAAVAELLDANGLSDRKLAEIHAHYLALYQSDDPSEKALGLKALDMAYKLKGAYACGEPETVEDYATAARLAYERRRATVTARLAASKDARDTQ